MPRTYAARQAESRDQEPPPVEALKLAKKARFVVVQQCLVTQRLGKGEECGVSVGTGEGKGTAAEIQASSSSVVVIRPLPSCDLRGNERSDLSCTRANSHGDTCTVQILIEGVGPAPDKDEQSARVSKQCCPDLGQVACAGPGLGFSCSWAGVEHAVPVLWLKL